jgi:hypothetical protein
MYYDQSEDSKTTSNLSLGPILITREQVCQNVLLFQRSFDYYFQIGIGIIVEMLSFLPGIIIIQLFQRTQQHRSHKYEVSPLRQTLERITHQPMP